jgi:HEAT repeat protein
MAVTETNEEAVKGIAALLKHEESRIKIAAASALALLGTRSKFAMNDLIELLKDEDVNVVMAGIGAIGSIEDPGRGARSAIEALLNDKNSKDVVKELAKLALDKIDGKKPDKPGSR